MNRDGFSQAYNPYGRGHMKLTGSNPLHNPDSLWSLGERASLRRLRQAFRRFQSWRSNGGSGTPRSIGGNASAMPEPTIAGLSPATLRFVLLCALWYMTSALSSNTGKAILMQFRYPVTLTIVQFAFVAGFSLICMSPAVGFTSLRSPTKAIFRTTLPMGLFQVGGHMFSSMAISRIPVSTVHTIKALSPLFTVAAYALLFGVSYSAKTYVSLLPLTIGVMLACTFDVSASNGVGLLCAFGSALVFVSSNIFFKKVMPDNNSTAAHKLDKLNLLLYSSGMAFVLMVPIWLWTDLPALLAAQDTPAHTGHVAHPSHGHAARHSVSWYFVANGTVHFLQNLIAFVILSSTSPVTYSIASLFKRVAVICIAVVWFSQRVHPLQALGIGLTFVGLWMYNNAKGELRQGEMRARRVERAHNLALPSTQTELRAEGADTLSDLAPTQLHAVDSFGTGAEMHVHRNHHTARGRKASVTARNALPPAPPALQTSSFPLQSHYAGMDGTSPSSARHHHNPPLQIKITPPTAHPSSAQYPSPPLSLDSPPLQERGLGSVVAH